MDSETDPVPDMEEQTAHLFFFNCVSEGFRDVPDLVDKTGEYLSASTTVAIKEDSRFKYLHGPRD